VILTNGGLTISECHAQQQKLILQQTLTYRWWNTNSQPK